MGFVKRYEPWLVMRVLVLKLGATDQKCVGGLLFREGARVLVLQKSGFCVLRSMMESDLYPYTWFDLWTDLKDPDLGLDLK